MQVKKLVKRNIRNNWLLYLTAGLVTMVMRCFIRTSDTDVLKWILAPTARWAGILGGISFEYMPHQGYVNHGYQFLIAASCSGIRFMLLTFLMLLFICASNGEGDLRKANLRLTWHIVDCREGQIARSLGRFKFDVPLLAAESLTLAYLSTIFVNGIRIVLSIRLPVMLDNWNLMPGRLTPDRLHTLIGTTVYFTSLCVIYLSAASKKGNVSLIVPAFWYLLIVLVLPFAKRTWRREWTGFGEYAILIIGVCLIVCTILLVVRKRKRLLHLTRGIPTGYHE